MKRALIIAAILAFAGCAASPTPSAIPAFRPTKPIAFPAPK